jgi:hypothetical protein
VTSIDRRSVVVLGALALLTAAASLALAPLNMYLDSVSYADAETGEERLDILRAAAAMLQTSGYSVGQLASLFLGVYARRRHPLLAVAGGAGLAAVSLAVTVFLSSPAGRELLLSDLLDRNQPVGAAGVDAWLWRDDAVRAVIVGLVEFPLWALLGVAAGRILGRTVVLCGGLAWYGVSQLGCLALAATNGVVLLLAPTYTSFFTVHVLAATGDPLVTVAQPLSLLTYGCLLLVIGPLLAQAPRGRALRERWALQEPPP